MSKLSRRTVIKLGVGALASSTLLGSFGGRGRAYGATADTSGYRALVCLYMYGGNNGFNWIVPTSSTGYAAYAKSRSNLALAQSSLLSLNGTASDGGTYGLHPSCPELQALFNAGHAAVLCNVGTLVQPTTPVQARSGSVPLPAQLFSHIDQSTEWMTSIPNSPSRAGWAGRIADFYATQGYAPKLSMNINVGGANYWQGGDNSVPYVLGTSGAPVMDSTSGTGWRNGTRAQAAQALVSQAATDPNLLVQQYGSIQTNAASKVGLVNGAFATAGDLTTKFPSFPGDTEIGQQLHEVARCIKAHSAIGDTRQIFFVQMGGFDTHNDELSAQVSLLQILSANLNAFWNAMVELGLQNNVTLFTASDFGRTLGSNGSGSDHAWGNHHVIMGGSVVGGKYYGTMPSLVLGGADDFGGGQVVPTTSTDQYAATLALWFGIADPDLNSIFPNLANFQARNLGFLG